MKHSNFAPFVGETWIFPLGKAFDLFHKDIAPALKEVKKSSEIFPKDSLVMRAFKEVPYHDVKVVILGQRPYLSGELATGLAFDTPKWCMSPTLRNIIKEIKADVGTFSGESNLFSHFEHLPSQGVLLLNAALTNSAGSFKHTDAWRGFTEEVIKSLQKRNDIVWVLWGKDVVTFKEFISNGTHKVVEGAHPSPFSYHLYKEQKFFTKINALIKGSPINW